MPERTVSALILSIVVAVGNPLTAKEVSREYQEALLESMVTSGVVGDAQRKTIIRHWDMLRTKGHEAGLQLKGWSYTLGDGDVVDSTSVEFGKEFGGKGASEGKLAVDSSGLVLEMTFNPSPILGALTSAERSNLVDLLAATCLIDPSEKGDVLSRLETAGGTGFSFTSRGACQASEKVGTRETNTGTTDTQTHRVSTITWLLVLASVGVALLLAFVLARRLRGRGVA